MTEQKYNNEVVEMQIKEGILYGTYLTEKVDLERAEYATAFRKKITLHKSYPALVDISAVKEVTREARSYFSQEAGDDLTAIAVLVNNPVTRMMVNFFMKFNQPKYPIRFFTNSDEAIVWLGKFDKLEALDGAEQNV